MPGCCRQLWADCPKKCNDFAAPHVPPECPYALLNNFADGGIIFGHLADSTHRPILISCASSQYLRRHLSGGTLRWLRSSADVDRSRMPSRAFSSKPYARSVRMNRKRRRALFSYAEEVCAYQISGAPARRSRLALRHVR
jgi:hypothetical protein